MTRFLLLVIVLLLPVQFAWAGMTASCQHETDPIKAQHIGHHEHAHQGSKRPPSNGKTIVGDTCAVCHGLSVTMTSTQQCFPIDAAISSRRTLEQDSHPPSVHARAPDRPQWLAVDSASTSSRTDS